MIKTNKKWFTLRPSFDVAAPKRGGFTLIELLVVIAIIGMLSTIVLVSLGSVRKKGRDTKRVADLRELQLALEMYYDSNRAFPTDIYSGTVGLAPAYVQKMPIDPLGGNYTYAGLTVSGAAASNCASYHLGARLEDPLNTALLNDSDSSGGTICTSGGTEFNGTSAGSGSACDNTAGTPAGSPNNTEQCYDIHP